VGVEVAVPDPDPGDRDLLERAVEPFGAVARLAGERAQRRHAHWQGIVRASCEQCGRNRLPEVMPVREIATWLGALPREAGEGELRFLLSPRASIHFSALPATPPLPKFTGPLRVRTLPPSEIVPPVSTRVCE